MSQDKVEDTNPHQATTILKKAYESFNLRDIDSTLAAMHSNVEWANGMEGGIERGRNAIRNYWERQWELVNPHVEPLSFSKDEDGRINVTVHQVVHD